MVNNETVTVENGTDVILALLFAGGSRKQENEEIVGNTRLAKLVFLLKQETSLKKYLTHFSYDAYNYGPYSSELFDALQALINAGLIKAENSDSEDYLDEADRFQIERQASDGNESPLTAKIHSLSSEGKTVGSALFRSLSKQEQQELTSIKKTFNSITLRKFLQYVYRKYPAYTTESVIKDYVY